MGWQDELRALDAALADRRITCEVHRKLREDLLASASGGAVPSPVASPLRRTSDHSQGAPTPPPAPLTRPIAHPRVPAPPPQRPPGPLPPGPKTVPTFTSSRSMTAPSPADLRTTDSMASPPRSTQSAPVDELTVVRPAVLPPPSRPPAAVLNNDPLSPNAPLCRLPAKRRSNWLWVTAGTAMVLIAIIAVTWWPSADSADKAGGVPRSTAVADTVAAVENRVATPPGFPNRDNSTMSVAKGIELNLYPPEAMRTFVENGITDVVYRASANGSDAYFILVLPAKSTENARVVIDYLGKGALGSGFTATFSKTMDKRLTVAGNQGDRLLTGSWYASGNVAVTLWVSHPASVGEAALTEKFNRMLSALQQNLPPSS